MDPIGSGFFRGRERRRPPSILVVDDDYVDVKALRRAMKKSGLEYELAYEEDGVAALARLRGSDGKERLEPPYVVLLDINMPRMNGHEFLTELRADPALRRTVVFVLTTSRASADVDAAFDRCVAGYFVKAKIGSTYTRMLTCLASYLESSELP